MSSTGPIAANDFEVVTESEGYEVDTHNLRETLEAWLQQEDGWPDSIINSTAAQGYRQAMQHVQEILDQFPDE